MKEKAEFNLLKYLYHLQNLEASQLEQMNRTIETNHPCFRVKTRAFINFPDVQRVTIKIKEATQLEDLTYLGISTDPEKEIQLKVGGEQEFVWPSGSFYLHYPVKTQAVVAFGKGNSSMGKSLTNSFKKPAISEPNEDEFKHTFKPVRIAGSDNYSIVETEDGAMFEAGDFQGNGSISQYSKVKKFEDKVKLFRSAGQSCWVVLQNNKIFFKGISSNYHFPNNESSSSAFKEFKIWENQDNAEPIVDLAVGNPFTLFLTEKNKIWAQGEQFLQVIDASSQKPVQINQKLPQGFTPLRIWASTSSSHLVAFVEVEDQAGNK